MAGSTSGRDESIGDGGFTLNCRGEVTLRCGTADCTPRSRKGRALIAVLAAEQGPLGRIRIIDLLWSASQEEQGRASLRTLLADLRAQFAERFDDLLTVDRDRLALGPGVHSDLVEPALANGRAGHSEPFGGLDHIDPELDDWLRLERARWRDEQAAGAAPPVGGPARPRRLRLPAAAVAIGTALLLLAIFAALNWKPRPTPEQTVAILPLNGAIGDRQTLFADYLMQGVRDGVRASPRARVLGDGSSRQLAATPFDPPAFKRQFGIDLILTASIRSLNGGDRMVARMTDAGSGAELWSAEYRIDPARLTPARDRIAQDLVERIRESLALEPSNPSLERWYRGPAGQRLAEARRLIRLNRPRQALEARRILLELIAAHPDNVPALASLGEATMAASDHSYVGGTLPMAEARQEARAYANRAIRLAPAAADGYAALGASYMETAQAIPPLRRAAALEPNNYLYRMRLGRALEFEDRYREAFAQQSAAVRLEPLLAPPMVNLIRAANELGRHDEIERRIASFAAKRPAPGALGYVRGYYAFLRDDNVACVRNFRLSPTAGSDPQERNILLFCLTALGENAAALRLLSDEDSLRRDVLVGNLDAIEGRVRKLGPDFWRRHYESLAAAEMLAARGRGRFLVEQFDASYNGIDDFIREGAFLTLYPQPLLVAFRGAGRNSDARKLRDVMLRTARSARARQGGDFWESYNGASVAMADGDTERAITLLERCAPTCIFTVLQRDVGETSLFGPLASNPRFDALIRRYRQIINTQRRSLGLADLPLA